MVECIIDLLVANGLFHDILCRSKSQAKSLSRCQLPPNMMSFGQMRKDLLKIYCKDTKELFLRHTYSRNYMCQKSGGIYGFLVLLRNNERNIC